VIAREILDAVTQYRMCDIPFHGNGFLAALGPGKPSRAAESISEVLAQPIRAALRSRVKDFGESASRSVGKCPRSDPRNEIADVLVFCSILAYNKLAP
jgi:hypothetical protein